MAANEILNHFFLVRRSFSQQSSQQTNSTDVGNEDASTTENDSLATSINNITETILTETLEEMHMTSRARHEDSVPNEERPADNGPEEIIREMDRDIAALPELRQRLNAEQPSTSADPPNSAPTDSQVSSEIPSTSTKDNLNVPLEENIQIKLKFLNEDIKIVSGSRNEPIGDFKKRNFRLELEEEKLVKLVFNGQVLLDNVSISNCGLFDNCVVHCLIHNRRNTNNPAAQGESPTQPANNGILPENGSFFIYLGIVLVLVTLIFCWFCRIQYSSLFSWYSTVGLVLMTSLFLVMLPLIVLIEREVFW